MVFCDQYPTYVDLLDVGYQVLTSVVLEISGTTGTYVVALVAVVVVGDWSGWYIPSSKLTALANDERRPARTITALVKYMINGGGEGFFFGFLLELFGGWWLGPGIHDCEKEAVIYISASRNQQWMVGMFAARDHGRVQI